MSAILKTINDNATINSPSGSDSTTTHTQFGAHKMFTATDCGWRNTLSGVALGVAGAASVACASALAFYAYHTSSADPAILVDPNSIKDIGLYGVAQIQSALTGLGQIQTFMSDIVHDHASDAKVGHVFDALQNRGVDLDYFKNVLAQKSDALAGQSDFGLTQRLMDPQTPLSGSAQTKLTEIIWNHDKQIALHQANANEALIFVKAGLSIALASMTTVASVNTDTMKKVLTHMKGRVHRIALSSGLIDDHSDRQIRKIIKTSHFDPVQARARIAAEYAERQNPMHRLFTQHWLEAARAQDRDVMIKLFAMEPSTLGKHTTTGQAVMIDNFSALEMRDIARNEPQYAKALEELAQRRAQLEQRGLRPDSSSNESDFVAIYKPPASLSSLAEATKSDHRRHLSNAFA